MDCGGGVIRHPAHSPPASHVLLLSCVTPHAPTDPPPDSFYRFVLSQSGQSAAIVGLYGRFRLPDRLPNSGRSSSGTSAE